MRASGGPQAGQEDQERVHHQEDDTKQHRGEEVLDGSRGRSRKINTWRPEREKERPSRSSRSSESGSRVDQHQTLRSPSVAGLCTRCQSRSDHGCGVELTSQYRMLRRGLLRCWVLGLRVIKQEEGAVEDVEDDDGVQIEK